MRTAEVIIVAFLAVALISPVAAPAPGIPVYSLTISPTVPINQGASVTLTLGITNAQRNSGYTVIVGVAKPNGTGLATTSRMISTNGVGVGSSSLNYPNPSFTATNGTVNTDVGGIYTVTVNQTAPSFTAGVATGQFTVISQLTVVLSQPSTGGYIQRGQMVTISATVSSPNGPVDTASAYADTPSNGKIYLQQLGSGVYSVNYPVEMYDPLGLWAIRVTAFSPGENTGVSNASNVTITKSSIVVEGLSAFNYRGIAVSSFSPGDAIIPFFRVRYSNGAYITDGQFRVAIKDPTGKEIANLTAVYDTSRFGFDVSAGYPISQFDPAGSWTVSIDAGTASDQYGNTGPDFTTSLTVQVVTITSPWGYLPFLIGGLAAVLGGVVAAKKLGRSISGFEHIEEVMGGPVPRASSVLILGEPGSGKSILSYEFLYDELENGHYCALLSYDVFPEDVQARMKEFGWEITSHLRKNRLKIVDCYSGLAGEGEGAIKDPSDLTELNIRITSIITRAKGAPVTLVLDSLTPIFNGVEGKQAVMFLQTVAAKVKKTGGIFYMTGSSGAIPNDSLSKVRSMVDGLIELSMVREHHKISRYLTVVKMERRKISTEAVPFMIDGRRGIVFKVSRLNKSMFRRGQESGGVAAKPPEEKPTPNQDLKRKGFLGRLRLASDRFWGISAPGIRHSAIPRQIRGSHQSSTIMGGDQSIALVEDSASSHERSTRAETGKRNSRGFRSEGQRGNESPEDQADSETSD
jgi:archaeal flagellar protein FlaH